MDNLFTKEGLQLATFKIVLDNYALQQAMFKMLSSIFTEMTKVQMSAEITAEMEVLKLQMEENYRAMADLYKRAAIENAAEFAAEHDPNLDIYTIK